MATLSIKREGCRNAVLCAALAACAGACSAEELDVYQEVSLRRAADEASARAKAAETARSVARANEGKSVQTLDEIRTVVGVMEK